ncbi:MAG: copper chaperone PCu(A)C [Sulfitobacter sp.]
MLLTCAFLTCACTTAAEGIKVENAYVPLAPPSAMSHVAYMTLENAGETTRSLIGVSAAGYSMTHLHESKETDGVAVMSMLYQLDIAPGQSVALKPGSFHVMLMRPEAPIALGDGVALTLNFANGEEIAVTAIVQERDTGS